MEPYAIIGLIFIIPIVNVLGVVLHELGHVIPGLLLSSGKIELHFHPDNANERQINVRSFTIGRVTVYYHFVYLWSWAYVKVSDSSLPWTSRLVISLGGPVVSLLFGLTGLAGMFSYPSDHLAYYLGMAVAISGIMAFFINIWPRMKDLEARLMENERINDGTKIWFLIKHKQQAGDLLNAFALIGDDHANFPKIRSTMARLAAQNMMPVLMHRTICGTYVAEGRIEEAEKSASDALKAIANAKERLAMKAIIAGQWLTVPAYVPNVEALKARALAVLDEVISEDSGQVNALYYRGTHRLATGDAMGAVFDLRRAWNETGKNLSIAPELANAYTANRMFAEAEEINELLLKKTGTNHLTTDLLVRQYMAQKDWKAAKDRLTILIYHDAKNWNAYYMRGQVALRAGDHRDAFDDFSKAIKWNKHAGLAWLGRAESILLQGGKSDALPDLEEGRRLLPGHAMTHRLEGLYAFHTGVYHRAITEFETAAQLDPASYDTEHWLTKARMKAAGAM